MPSTNTETTSAFSNMYQYLQSCGGNTAEIRSLGVAALYLIEYGSLNNPSKHQRELIKSAIEVIKNSLPSTVSDYDFCEKIRQFAPDTISRAALLKELMQSSKTDGWSAGGMSSTGQVIDLVCKILDIQPKDTVLDMGSGMGSFLAEASAYSDKDGAKCHVVGEEINANLSKISEMYLDMAGADYEILNKDSILNEPVPFSKGYVFPPFGMRYGADYIGSYNNKYGLIFNSKSNTEWLFVFKALEGMKKNGRLVALLPEGALFRGPSQPIRKYLIENHLLEGIIALPSKIFPYTSVLTDLVVIGSSKRFTVVDARKLADTDIKRMSEVTIPVDEIVAMYNSDVADTFTEKDAASRDYNLAPSSYLETEDVLKDVVNPTSVNEVAEIVVGSQYTISHFKNDISTLPTDYQLLVSSNIENGLIDYDLLTYITPDEKLLKFELHEGDIVLTTKSTKVKTAVIQDLPERHIIVTGGMIIIRPDREKMNPTYLKMYLDSEIGQAVLRTVQKGAIITTISTNEFKVMKVANPPLKEQEKLAGKYNQLLFMYEGMKQELKNMELELSEMYLNSLKEAD